MYHPKLNHINLKDKFLSFTDSQMLDYKFLSSFIYDEVGIALNHKALQINDAESLTCWGGVMAKQYPDELAKFLVFIYQHRNEINSYCEIGAERGGTFFTVDSLLRAFNPNMGNSLAIDIRPFYVECFKRYTQVNPQAKLIIENSNVVNHTQSYDLCFIDANHKYLPCLTDFNVIRPYANKYIAFHDIYLGGESGGVNRIWRSLEGEKYEFINEDNRFPMPLGIGVWKNDSVNSGA